MRRFPIILAMFCLLGTLSFGRERTFSFLVSGGLTRINPRDLNAFLQDYADYYLYYINGTAGPEMATRELRTSYELEFTLFVRAAPRMFLTLGSGFIQARLESDPLLQSYGDLRVSLFRTDRVQSFPIKLGLLYSWLVSRRLSLCPHLSVDGYISRFSDQGYEERNFQDPDYINRYDWTISTHALSWGATAGLALDIAFSERVSLWLDAGYRSARLSGFHGTDIRSANGEFHLFYSEFYSDWTKRDYRFLNLPSAYGFTSLDVVRDAVLDLSGPYLRAGLRVYF